VKVEFDYPVKEGDCVGVEFSIYLATAIEVPFRKVLEYSVDKLREKKAVVCHFRRSDL